MLTAIQSSLAIVWEAVGGFVTNLTATNGVLAPILPVFALGIAISLSLLGVKIVRGLIWGA